MVQLIIPYSVYSAPVAECAVVYARVRHTAHGKTKRHGPPAPHAHLSAPHRPFSLSPHALGHQHAAESSPGPRGKHMLLISLNIKVRSDMSYSTVQVSYIFLLNRSNEKAYEDGP